MKIVIFGASGRTGSELTKTALKDHHDVTAVVRRPECMPLERPGLFLFEADVLEKEKVYEAVKGHDAVLVALGADDISKPFKMISEGIRNILEGMEKAGVKRIVTIFGPGILNHPSGKMRGEVDHPPFMKFLFEDNIRAFKLLQNSKTEWTAVCPNLMPTGPKDGKYRISEDVLPEDPKPVTVGNVADIMYKAVLENRYIKKRVGVSG